MIIVGVDTNIVLRFLLRDDENLFTQAKELFSRGERGEIKIYLDDLVVAETVWTLSSFYKQTKADIFSRLYTLISQKWVNSSRKRIVLESLKLFNTSNLSYIDCWLLAVCRHKKLELKSFDNRLLKIHKKR